MQMKTAFGFKTVTIGRLTIFTGKIRIKSNAQFLEHKLQNYLEHIRLNEIPKNCAVYTTISFETTSGLLNKQLIVAINNVLREIMHDRIDAKYCPEVHDFEPIDYLPF